MSINGKIFRMLATAQAAAKNAQGRGVQEEQFSYKVRNEAPRCQGDMHCRNVDEVLAVNV